MEQSRSPRVKHPALPVADDLHLDVVGVDDDLLEVELAVPEGDLGFGRRGQEVALHVGGAIDHAHPAASAAGRGLQHDRVAHLVGQHQSLGDRAHGAVAAGDGG